MENNEGMFGAHARRVTMPVCDRVSATEISNDYTLPDYQSEIRRVLYVGTSVLPPAKYVSTGGAEFNGTVDYTVLYVGGDGELYSVPLSAEYAFTVPIDADSNFDFNEGVTACADLTVENVTVRVGGPRKLTIKSRIKSHARAYATMLLDEKAGGEVNPLSIQRLDENCEVCRFIRGSGEILEISEEIIPDAPDTRVIGAQAKVFVSDASATQGGVSCRGEVILDLLCTTDGEGGSVSSAVRRIPFSHSVELDDVSPECKCSATGYVSDISVNVEEGRILCDISVIVDAEAQKKESFTYTRDIYSTEKNCESAYRDYRLPVSGICQNGNFSMNERLSKTNLGIPENAEIIDVFASASADDISVADTKTLVNGQGRFSLLLCDGGEYSVSEIILPFRYETDAAGEIASSDASVNVVSCRARQDADSVAIDAELAIALRTSAAKEIIAISEASFGGDVNRQKSDIVICYPAPDDTLWSVAKRYFVPVSRICASNGITDSIKGKEYLII